MEITNVEVRKFEKGNLLGFANVEFNKVLIIKDFTVMTGKNGKFVKAPSVKGSDGNYYPTIKMDKQLSDSLEAAVLKYF